jgi:diadenosine tetraphosphate (Ap4A) HIT family hydrolase
MCSVRSSDHLRNVVQPDCPLCHVPPSRIVYETPRLRVLVPMGPIVPGHVLLCTKEHIPNFWSASSSLRRELAELIRLCEKVIMSNYAREFVTFEHGVLRSNPRQSIHCLHAHRNLVPTRTPDLVVQEIVRSFQHEGINMRSARGLPLPGPNMGLLRDYYYFGCQQNPKYLSTIQVNELPPRRIFRRAFSRFLKRDHDLVVEWETHPKRGTMHASWRSLKAAFGGSR